MMTMKKVYLECEHPILTHLVEEHAKRQTAWQLSPVKDSCDLCFNPMAVGLKFPLRIGEVIDKISYELSGRNRFAPTDSDHIIGGFTLSGDGNFLSNDETDKKINLTDKEYLILKSLSEHDEAGLDRQALLSMVWGYAESVETHTIETHMYRLRQKLEQEFGALIEITNTGGLYKINTP